MWGENWDTILPRWRRFDRRGQTSVWSERYFLLYESEAAWVEEHVRRSRHRKLLRAWPKRPMASGDVVREKLVVKPHAIERVGYTVEYVF